MKMGNIASPWRYEAPAFHGLRAPNLRRFAILRYASGAFAFDGGRADASVDDRGVPGTNLSAAAFL